MNPEPLSPVDKLKSRREHLDRLAGPGAAAKVIAGCTPNTTAAHNDALADAIVAAGAPARPATTAPADSAHARNVTTSPGPAATALPANVADARQLYAQYADLQGRERAEFFERHETALHSAAQLIEADDSAASQAAPTDVASARALLAKYDALDGREKGRFFDEHEDELKAAAAVLVDPSAA